MKIWPYPIVGLVVVLSATAGFIWGGKVSASTQATLYENLLTCSAIVFGVMGAWIAIIYPRTMQRVSDVGTANHSREASVYSALRPAMLTSTTVLAIVLLFAPIAAIVVEQPIFRSYEVWCLRVSMSVILTLTGTQLFALFTSLAPFVITEDEINAEAQRQEALESIERRK